MTKPKYKKGRRIQSVADFSRTCWPWFIVEFGNTKKTLNRGFLISWQYRTLEQFVNAGRVFVANPIGGENE